MLNQVVLVGRLTENPSINETENGLKVTTVTVAVQRSFKNVDGLYDTDFIRCVLWNNVAANTTEYCKSGDVIGIKGRIQTSNYQDKEGNKKYATEVIAEKVTFLSSKSSDEKKGDEKKKADKK